MGDLVDFARSRISIMAASAAAEERMDPIKQAIESLRLAGIMAGRTSDPFELYDVAGFGELTRGQLFDLARQRSGPLPPA